MSGLKPITVNTPTEDEAHIYAEDDAAIYQSLFGEDGVSSVGQACKATVLSNNKVRVADGVICVGGHFARIPYGDYIDCEIENGQSGQNRNDIIVARFETTGTGGIDTYTCEVKKGMAGSTATDPEIVQEDLYKAGKVRELPLYRVKIEGLSITAVEQLFTLRKTNEELEKELVSLNSKTIKAFGASESDYISFTAPFDCYAIIGFSCLGWGYDGGFLEFQIKSSEPLPEIFAHTGGCSGNNSVYIPLLAKSCFSGLKKGKTYSFSRKNLYGSFGTSWNIKWSAICIPA
jgi:hypothetical protein